MSANGSCWFHVADLSAGGKVWLCNPAHFERIATGGRENTRRVEFRGNGPRIGAAKSIALFDRMPERCDRPYLFHPGAPYIHGWKRPIRPCLAVDFNEGSRAFAAKPLKPFRGPDWITMPLSADDGRADAEGWSRSMIRLKAYLDQLDIYRPRVTVNFIDDVRTHFHPADLCLKVRRDLTWTGWLIMLFISGQWQTSAPAIWEYARQLYQKQGQDQRGIRILDVARAAHPS